MEVEEEEEVDPAANFLFLEPRPAGGGGSFSGGIFRGKEEEKKSEC